MTVGYQQLVESVAEAAGLDPADARAAAEATFTALARTVNEDDRRLLLGALPSKLHGDQWAAAEPRRGGAAGGASDFVQDVAGLGGFTPEQARVRCQAVLGAFARQDRDLADRLTVPGEVRDLFTTPDVGGGLAGAHGHVPALTPDELATALETLPDWSGDIRGIGRTIYLPDENLDRVLEHVDGWVRRELGRAPHVRRGDGWAELRVRNDAVEAVTALDLELAAMIGDLIVDADAGLAAPSE